MARLRKPAAPPGAGREVKIVVLPGNVALVHPSSEQLGPLDGYRPFLIEDGGLAGGLTDEEVVAARGLSPCSAYPAGLVPRFRDELTAAGYRVDVEDRRQFGEGFGVNDKMVRKSVGSARPFLGEVLAEPLGQLESRCRAHMVWKIGALCCVYPEARTLIVADASPGADMLYSELRPHLKSLGVLGRDYVGEGARCLVTTLTWLTRLRLRAWHVVLLVVNYGRGVSKATYRALVRGRVPRVYSLVWHDERRGKITQLRLEALAGRVCRPGMWI